MKGVVASGHPVVTAAACEILRAGGNAFDAVVAAGFASAVAEPGLTSLGGGGFLLVRKADGEARLFDFFVDTPGRGSGQRPREPHFVPLTVAFPGSRQSFNVGLGSVAVPGSLRGYLYVHRQLGRMPLAEVIAPALALARDGLTVTAFQAYTLELLRPVMTLTEAARTIYSPGGDYLEEGRRLVNRSLADFLASLPAGGEREFYEGTVARRIAEDMREGGGLLGVEDLAGYRVIEREPLSFSYRGHRILTNPTPSFGGSLLGLSLHLLGYADVAALGFGSPGHLLLLASAMQQVDVCRERGFRDLRDLTAAELAAAASAVRSSSGGTTHVSVCDGDGNAASMTTSNGECSGYIAAGTGIMLNNMLGEDDLHPDGFLADPPGLRVASMMSPAMLVAGSRLRAVVGSGGSKRIRTALTQVISNLVDFEMALPDAIEAPRLHWDGSELQAEAGFDRAAMEELTKRWPVNAWAVRDVYFGGAHAVTPEGSCAGDSRRGGAASVIG